MRQLLPIPSALVAAALLSACGGSEERSADVGTETNEVTSVDASVTTPAGEFSPALQIAGHVEPDNEDEVKSYAEGIGVIAEEGPGGTVSLVDPGPR